MNCDQLTEQQQIAEEVAAVDLSNSLPEKAAVGRYTIVPDDSGGRTETWPLDAGTIDCRVAQMHPHEAGLLGEKIRDGSMGYKISTGKTVDLKTMDRLVISPTTYEVLGVQEKASFSFLHAYWCAIVSGF